MKTEGTIVKTYHLGSSLEPWGRKFHERIDRTVFDQDLTPFVKYTLNKKKRWEAEGNPDILYGLQRSYQNMGVMVAERVSLRSTPHYCIVSINNYYRNFFDQFPIRHLHQLQDHNYQCQSTNSIRGQPFKSLQPENRTPTQVTGHQQESSANVSVAYHIITPPKNYEVLRNKDFRVGHSDRNGIRTIARRRRFQFMKEAVFDLKNEILEDFGDSDDDDENEILLCEESCGPRKFYNLHDHLVKSNHNE